MSTTIKKFHQIEPEPLAVTTEELQARMDKLDVPRQATRPSAVPPVKRNAETKPPLRKVSLQLPEYLWDELHDRARKQRCSMRHVIMRALVTEGFTIETDDLVEDGRKVRT